jgi:hypothetical protein
MNIENKDIKCLVDAAKIGNKLDGLYRKLVPGEVLGEIIVRLRALLENLDRERVLLQLDMNIAESAVNDQTSAIDDAALHIALQVIADRKYDIAQYSNGTIGVLAKSIDGADNFLNEYLCNGSFLDPKTEPKTAPYPLVAFADMIPISSCSFKSWVDARRVAINFRGGDLIRDKEGLYFCHGLAINKSSVGHVPLDRYLLASKVDPVRGSNYRIILYPENFRRIASWGEYNPADIGIDMEKYVDGKDITADNLPEGANKSCILANWSNIAFDVVENGPDNMCIYRRRQDNDSRDVDFLFANLGTSTMRKPGMRCVLRLNDIMRTSGNAVLSSLDSTRFILPEYIDAGVALEEVELDDVCEGNSASYYKALPEIIKNTRDIIVLGPPNVKVKK